MVTNRLENVEHQFAPDHPPNGWSSNRVYRLNDGQVTKESVEKRHLLNVIVKEDNHTDAPVYYRWKVVLNRSKIVSIEKIELN